MACLAQVEELQRESSTPTVPLQSPFANFDPQSTMKPPEASEMSARGQRALENISPLFERLILEAESGSGIQDEAEPVKRRLDLDSSAEPTLLHSPQ